MKNIDWPVFTFISGYQFLWLISLPLYFHFFSLKLNTIIVAIILTLLTGISITAGYHRLYAHKTYSANLSVEIMFLFFATLAAQGSVFEWASKHRLHHQFVDQDKDPYNVKKGFFHAHMLWFLQKQESINMSIILDLDNKILRFQHKYCLYLTILANILVFILFGTLLNDFIGVFIFVILGRMFYVHHGTWLINSAAHYWGTQTYTKELSAVDNYFISIFTFGEGYHNYHHVFATDYRNGIRWYHFDPTKWLINILNKVGLVSDLKRIEKYTSQIRLIGEDKKMFLDKLKQTTIEKKPILEKRVSEISEQLNSKITQIRNASGEYKSFKKENVETKVLKSLKVKIKELKSSLRKDWSSWDILGKEVMSLG